MRVALLLICLGSASTARAEPTILLDRCSAYDREALRTAIARELAATRARIRDDVTLIVECKDPLTVRLVVEGPQIALEHALDLGEVETELRPKLLVLSVVELVKVASAPRSADGKLVANADVTVVAPIVAKPIAPRVARVEPRPRPEARVEAVVRAPNRREPRTLAISPRAGVRVYADEPVPLAHLAIDLEWWRFAVGIAGSAGTTDDTLGTLRPYVATLAASLEITCLRGRRDKVCLRTRGEAGLAGVTARGANNMVKASNAQAFYGQLGIGLEAEHTFGALATMIAIDGAWAEGLVVTAQSRTPVRLDGPAVTTVIGVRWRR